MTDPVAAGLPPIEVYRIGDAYFVIDGNHRVSVARTLNAHRVRARVTEVTTRVPLSADDDREALAIKGEYVRFLTRTRLDETHTDVNLLMTRPGNTMFSVPTSPAWQAGSGLRCRTLRHDGTKPNTCPQFALCACIRCWTYPLLYSAAKPTSTYGCWSARSRCVPDAAGVYLRAHWRNHCTRHTAGCRHAWSPGGYGC